MEIPVEIKDDLFDVKFRKSLLLHNGSKDVGPNFFNIRLQGYTTHKAQIDYLEGYHSVFDASTYEMMPHPRY